VRDQIDQRGTLDVLRHGIELLGLKTPLKLAEFKPALAINEDILARYAANRLRVVRQVRYSRHNENSIDLVLFLNGLPVATVELKTDFTQSIGDAIDQYRVAPILDAGSGTVKEQQKVYMAELIEKLNDLFGADTTEQDKLSYVNGTLFGKVMESATLMQQAANNSREQFANSPDLAQELKNAVMDSYDAHTSMSMSTQALNSPIVLRGILDVLLNHSQLYEALRSRTP
jgi:hypothetical protein